MKLGIALKNLGPHQLAYYAIRNTNLFLRERPKDDAIIFYENHIRPCFHFNFAVMQIYESYCYDGIMIATCLSTASKLLKAPGSKTKFFYVWDLEWLRFTHRDFKTLSNLYNNPQLKLITRSTSHKELIEDCWNTKVHGIVDDFNYSELLKVIDKCKS